MRGTVNALRRAKPARDRCLLHGRFYFTDERGKLASGVGTRVYLTEEFLWITPELALPLDAIDSVRIVTRRGVPTRRFLEIRYTNPITSAGETVSLCKMDALGIGLYLLGPIQELARRVGELLPQHRTSTSAGTALEAEPAPRETPADVGCEVCGAKPAHYVGYLFLVSAVILCYRSEARRRIHCRKHNALHGLGYYFLTALTGWIGIGVFAYPFVVFAAGRNLAPSLGKASYVLAVLPTVGLAALVARWLL